MTQTQIDTYRVKFPDCQMCDRSRNTGVHHIIFRSQGGTDEEENLITLCESFCGCKAHNKAHGKEHRKNSEGGWVLDKIEVSELRMIKALDAMNPGNS